MSRKNIVALVMVIILVTSFFSGCKQSGKTGDFYPYKLSDYVTLGDYTKIDYEPVEISVTDDDIDNEIRARFKENALTTMQEKADAIENGDTAIINYVGYLNGETFEGGSAQNSALEIGSGKFIDGFESGLIGKKAGETVTLNLKFPDGYHNADFAGKAVIFEVEITKVYETIYPEITFENISKITSLLSLSEYKKEIYDELLEEKTEEITTSNRNTLIASVIECCEIKKYPDAEVEDYKSELIKSYEKAASSDSLTLETLVSYNGLTMEQFEEKMEQSAKNLVAKEMVFLMIAEKEKLEITGEEYEENLAIQMNANKITSRKTFLEAVGEDTFKGLLLIEKAVDHLDVLLTSDTK